MTPRIASPEIPDSTPERAMPAGTRLEEYEIEGLIANGSLALVYRAYDRVLKLHVAIREYLPDALARRGDDVQVVLREREHAQCFERGRQAFVNESRVLAHCQHPALPRVLRIVHHHGTVCRVMRCCPGPSLLEHRQALAGPPDAATLRAWLDGLLGALDELHGQGFVHGAVSPAKILMLPGQGPVLMSSDAVRAALISGSTRGMMASLGPGFMPLEQREPSADRPLGPWTDLYALAATLHFFIGGQAPAPLAADAPAGFEPLGALWQRLHGGPAVAPASLGVLDACLAESAAQRPQSVAQLRALLEAQDAATRLQQGALSGAWAMADGASAGQERFPMVTVPARHVDDLQQTLPFVAARAHAITAAASAAVRPARPVVTPARRRRWMTGAALMVMLTVSVAAGEWMRNRNGSAPLPSQPPAPNQAVVGRAAVPTPLPAALPAQPASLELAPTGAGRPPARLDAAAAADAAPAVEPTPRAPVAPAAPSPVAQADPRADDSPRSRCGTRSGYALYQCMQTQCAKRGWAQHTQCRRLREQQSLG